jgi:L-histidine N-alpha-methyltransferase
MALLANNNHEGCLYIAASRHVNSLEEDVRQGLLDRPRCLPPKYFYDETGSRLFDRICDTPEYYPTRTEAALLEASALELVTAARPQHILEFGSGTSRKTHYLLQACEKLDMDCEYLPFDVCEEMLLEVRDEFSEQYDWLDVLPLVGDYTAGLDHLYRPKGTCMYVFLGSSIGNFNDLEARAFIAEVAGCMKPGDSLLLGVDRVKDDQVLQAAYNDVQGVTEQFNLNVLEVLNRQLQADFAIQNFRHRALYNAERCRIEMYLVSQQAQTVQLDAMAETLQLSKHESILTEVSHKYTRQGAEDLLTRAGLHILDHIQPPNAYFSLILAGL